MKKGVLFIILFALSIVVFGQEKSNQSTIYNVKVEIKELKNRTLRCLVRNHEVILDQPKAFGADDLGPTPPEMLAISYGGCIVSTMQFLAYQKQLVLSNILVTVEGNVDFAKAMGMQTNSRAGFSNMKVKVSFHSSMSPTEKEDFMNRVLAVGAVLDNVANKTDISLEIIKE